MDNQLKQTGIVSPALSAEIQKLKAGNTESYEDFYNLSASYIYAMICDIVGTVDAAGAILNDTYSSIYQTISQLSDDRLFYQWAGRIATDKALAYILPNGFSVSQQVAASDYPFEDVSFDHEPFIPEAFMQDMELQRIIKEEMDKLSPTQKVVMQYYYYEGLSVSAIAGILSCDTNTVKAVLSQIRYSLKNVLAAYGNTHPTGGRFYSLSEIPVFWMAFTNMINISLGIAPCAVAGAIIPTAVASGVVGGTASGTVSGTGTVGGVASGAVNGTGAGIAGGAASGGSSSGAVVATAAAKAGLGLGAKIGIGVAAATLVAGGTIATIKIVDKNKEPKAPATIEEIASDTDDKTEDITTEEVVSSEETTEATTEEPTTEDPLAALQEKSLAAYQRFLDNEAAATCTSNTLTWGSLVNTEDIGKTYTIQELLYIPSDIWGNPGERYIKYSYIDCGNDGVNELAVNIVVAGEDGEYSEASYNYAIIKYIDGELRICATTESFYRTYGYITYYGGLTTGGSGGASTHYSSEAVVLADGSAYTIYESCTEGTPDFMTYWDNRFETAFENYKASGGTSDYPIGIIQYTINDNYIYAPEVYSDDPLSDDANLFISCIKETGINIVSTEEMNSILQERYDYAGHNPNESDVEIKWEILE